MNDDLYFVAILAAALAQPKDSPALQEAFAQIQALGRQGRYARGFDQFQAFIATAIAHRRVPMVEPVEEWMVQEILVELATDSFDGIESERRAALDVVLSRAPWRQAFEELAAETRQLNVPSQGPELVLSCDDRPLARMVLGRQLLRHSGARPGLYAFALDSGRVLWSERLERRHLVWSAAFPGKPLRLAADTGQSRVRPAYQAKRLKSRLVVRVLPGVEGGCIVIEVKP